MVPSLKTGLRAQAMTFLFSLLYSLILPGTETVQLVTPLVPRTCGLILPTHSKNYKSWALGLGRPELVSGLCHCQTL